MHNTSDIYKEILAGGYQTENALQIGGSDAVGIRNELSGNVYYKDMIRNMKTSASVFEDSEKPIGNCRSRKIEITMHKPDEEIPRRARLVPYVRIVGGGRASEWIPKGVYYLDTRRESPGGGNKTIIKIEGLDSMMAAEQLYKDSALGTAALDIDIVREIAGRIGVGVDARTATMMNKGFTFPVNPDYTYRETLGYIASLYAGNFAMSDIGELQLIPLNGGAGNA